MVASTMRALCIGALLLVVAVDATHVTPIQKVIDLMKNLEEEISNDGAKEAGEDDA